MIQMDWAQFQCLPGQTDDVHSEYSLDQWLILSHCSKMIVSSLNLTSTSFLGLCCTRTAKDMGLSALMIVNNASAIWMNVSWLKFDSIIMRRSYTCFREMFLDLEISNIPA